MKQSSLLVKPILSGLALLLITGTLFAQLSNEWSTNPQYSYGWFVPLFCLYFLGRDLKSLNCSESFHSVKSFWILSFFCFLLMVPVWWLAEANPDWRLVNWVLVFPVIICCLLVEWALGGRQWLKSLSFPVFFILIAVPWPSRFDILLTTALQKIVTLSVIDMLNWIGVYAEQKGPVIKFVQGAVRIDEACSGIRSFQASMMVGLFLGHLFYLKFWARVFLFFVAPLIAFLANIGRAFVLAYLASEGGDSAVNTWHDQAGYTELAIVFVILMILVQFLPKWDEPKKGSAGVLESLSRIPQIWSLSVIVVFFAMIGGTQWWYASREQSLMENPRWEFQFLDLPPFAKVDDVPVGVQVILKYDKGSTGKWFTSSGHYWHGFFFRWEPGSSSPLILASHGPEICLPNIGIELSESFGVSQLNVDGLSLPFEVYEFKDNGRPLYVFRSIWPDKSSKGDDWSDTRQITPMNRILSAWYGKRNVGRVMLLLAVWNAENLEQAKESLVNQLKRGVVRLEDPS